MPQLHQSWMLCKCMYVGPCILAQARGCWLFGACIVTARDPCSSSHPVQCRQLTNIPCCFFDCNNPGIVEAATVHYTTQYADGAPHAPSVGTGRGFAHGAPRCPTCRYCPNCTAWQRSPSNLRGVLDFIPWYAMVCSLKTPCVPCKDLPPLLAAGTLAVESGWLGGYGQARAPHAILLQDAPAGTDLLACSTTDGWQVC